jgi:hypothetical protein
MSTFEVYSFWKIHVAPVYFVLKLLDMLLQRHQLIRYWQIFDGQLSYVKLLHEPPCTFISYSQLVSLRHIFVERSLEIYDKKNNHQCENASLYQPPIVQPKTVLVFHLNFFLILYIWIINKQQKSRACVPFLSLHRLRKLLPQWSTVPISTVKTKYKDYRWERTRKWWSLPSQIHNMTHLSMTTTMTCRSIQNSLSLYW